MALYLPLEGKMYKDLNRPGLPKAGLDGACKGDRSLRKALINSEC
jgi:hypothetical protein